MAWLQVDDYYLKNGLWTITRAINVPLPYGLYKGDKNYGYFATSTEAKQTYERLKND